MATKPPDDDERALLADLGARHRLWPEGSAAIVLARGSENTTFSVGGCIVRLAHDKAGVAREVGVLQALAGTTAVATPVPLLHDADLGLLVYRALPGEPLLLRERRDGTRVAEAIAAVLTALRTHVDAETLPSDEYSTEAWHRDAVENFRAVRPRLDGDRAAAVERFLCDAPPPTSSRRAPQHNDLGAEHILVDDHGAVTAVIDWTDAASADPARDLGLLYRDLGGAAAFRVGEALDGPLPPGDRARVRFLARCAWLEDVRFALDDPDARAPYLRNAMRTFAHTFLIAE